MIKEQKIMAIEALRKKMLLDIKDVKQQ